MGSSVGANMIDDRDRDPETQLVMNLRVNHCIINWDFIINLMKKLFHTHISVLVKLWDKLLLSCQN